MYQSLLGCDPKFKINARPTFLLPLLGFDPCDHLLGIRILLVEVERALIATDRFLVLAEQHVGFAQTVPGVETLGKNTRVEFEYLERFF